MSKLPRRAVIEKQVAIAIEASSNESIAASDLENVQGGLGFAPMYGAPRPPWPPGPRPPWGKPPWGGGRPFPPFGWPRFPFGHRRR